MSVAGRSAGLEAPRRGSSPALPGPGLRRYRPGAASASCRIRPGRPPTTDLKALPGRKEEEGGSGGMRGLRPLNAEFYRFAATYPKKRKGN